MFSVNSQTFSSFVTISRSSVLQVPLCPSNDSSFYRRCKAAIKSTLRNFIQNYSVELEPR